MGLKPLTAGTPPAYRETDSTDTATTDDYADFADIDCRGSESVALTVENTDGSNGITVDAVEEYTVYGEGEENSLSDFPQNVAAGNRGLIRCELPKARLVVKCKNQTGGQNASARVRGLINLL